jgi:hypothetical protein
MGFLRGRHAINLRGTDGDDSFIALHEAPTNSKPKDRAFGLPSRTSWQTTRPRAPDRFLEIREIYLIVTASDFATLALHHRPAQSFISVLAPFSGAISPSDWSAFASFRILLTESK